MVLISECFPSNHNSVNTVRESYRASVLSANLPVVQQTEIINKIPSKEPSVTDSVESIEEITHEYPGGIRAFLEKSKMTLSSPDDIEMNLKKVQQLVTQMTKAALNVPSGVRAVAINIPKEERNSSDYETETIFQNDRQVSRNNIKSVIIKSDDKMPSVSKTSSVQVRPNSQAYTSSISPNITTQNTNNTQASTTDCKNCTASTTPKPFVYKKPKNTSTPRYLDVFTKQHSVNEIREVSSSTTKFANARFTAKFEQNWTPLTVSVVNIEL